MSVFPFEVVVYNFGQDFQHANIRIELQSFLMSSQEVVMNIYSCCFSCNREHKIRVLRSLYVTWCLCFV